MFIELGSNAYFQEKNVFLNKEYLAMENYMYSFLNYKSGPKLYT